MNKAASQLEQDLHHSARGKEYEQRKSDKNGDGTAVILTKAWVNDFFIVAALAMSTFHHIDNDCVRPFSATVRRYRQNDVFASDSLPAVRANTAAPAVKYCRPRSQILPPPQSNTAAPPQPLHSLHLLPCNDRGQLLGHNYISEPSISKA